MKNFALLVGFVGAMAALPAAAEAADRDRDGELLKQRNVSELLCLDLTTAKDRSDCEEQTTIIGLIIACLSLYRDDSAVRLECYDDRAMGIMRGYMMVLEQKMAD